MCIIWGYIYILYASMFSLTNISGTVCSKKKHFEYILKKASICHVYLWKPLKISSCLALFILISSHGVAAKPGTWVAANVTGRFTARTFHSRKLAGVFGRKKRSCVRVNLIFTSPPEGVARYCFHPVCLCVCVCVCVCVSVCPANILIFYFSATRRDIDLKLIQDT